MCSGQELLVVLITIPYWFVVPWRNKYYNITIEAQTLKSKQTPKKFHAEASMDLRKIMMKFEYSRKSVKSQYLLWKRIALKLDYLESNIKDDLKALKQK